MKVVHFGAGNIGKGLIGIMLHDSNFEIIFVDTSIETVEELVKKKSYEVKVIGSKTIKIDNVDAYLIGRDEAMIVRSIANADLITTSVGVSNLEKIAPLILKGLEQRQSPVDIIANENMINASDFLKEKIHEIVSADQKTNLQSIAYFSNSAIDRLALPSEIAGIPLVESYAEWVIDNSYIINESTYKIKNATYTKDMLRYIERKLFCVNANHAAAAYLGYKHNLTYIYEVFQQKILVNIIMEMHREIANYFVQQYGVDYNIHMEFISQTVRRHADSQIKDEIIRVGRNPLRKLGSKERLVAPFLNLSNLNMPRKALATVIASAFHFVDIGETSLIKNASDILVNICKLDKEEDKQLILTNI